MDNKLNIDFLNWHIQRNDNLRNSITNRATIILSANALVIAGLIFILDKLITLNHLVIRLILLVLVFFCLLSVLISVIYAITSMLSIWNSKGKTKNDEYRQDEMLFYTVLKMPIKNEFVEKIDKTCEEDFIKYAKTSFWYGSLLFYQRYQRMRKSIKWLLSSLISFIISTSLYLIYSLMI